MSYEFSRFSTTSFERFSQSMACARFGSGVQVYGAGADGAREATFEGICSPDEGRKIAWDGYVVVQAKFLAKPTTTQADLEWLKGIIDKDLAKFQDKRRNLRSPDYYVVVTNVTLTAGAADINGKRGGSLDAMRNHLNAWSSKIGFKDFFIWDQNVLSRFLDLESELRKTFAAWTTPGDVLSQVLSHFCPPEFKNVIGRLVRDELRECRSLKTRDSGQSQSRPLYIDEVFVDLPLVPQSLMASELNHEAFQSENGFEVIDSESEETTFDDDYPDFDEGEINWNVVNALMEKSADSLSPSLFAHPKQSRRPLANRVVILGGPGQGKSTIGQFLAQLLRSRFISHFTSATPDLQEIATATNERAASEGIFISGPFRFPLHIELPKYADFISKSPGATIMRFASNLVAGASDENVEPRHMHEWLAAYPAVIILDGLDEVPRSGNRTDVILSINKLVEDLHVSNADVLFVVTSRPQGYLNDLDKKYWAHWDMAELDAVNATRFFTRLSSVLIPNARIRTEVLENLSAATKDPSTSPLMISPLQISLLFSLVETRNDIPRDRWTLFEKHYEILRDREISKGGHSGELIRNFRADIDKIHYDAGYLLQVRAESSGRASAFFRPAEFEEIVKRQLSRSLVEEDDIASVTSQIVEIATTRLVFLGAKNEDQIAFDVRSLQEFMAAARIMVSPENLISLRLKEIAVKTHWQNVFKIACSKVYAIASLEDYRDEICRIIDRLDAGDEGMEYRVIKAGAKLAIALLTDSTAGSRPAERQALITRALRILEIPDTKSRSNLSSILDSRSLKTLDFVVSENLQNYNGIAYLETLRLILGISRDSRHALRRWAIEKTEAALKKNPSVLVELIDVSAPATGDESESLYRRIVWTAGPGALRGTADYSEDPMGSVGVLTRPFWDGPLEEMQVRAGEKAKSVFSLRYRPIRGFADIKFIEQPPAFAHPDWRVIAKAIEFSNSPSKASLVEVVKARRTSTQSQLHGFEFPWPIAEAFKHLAEPDRVEDAIEAGALGDANDWHSAEKRWRQLGIDFAEATTSYGRRVMTDIAVSGGPPFRGLVHNRTGHQEDASRLTMAACLQAFRTAGPEERSFLLLAVRQLSTAVPEEDAYNALLEVTQLLDLSSLSDLFKQRLINIMFALSEERWLSADILHIGRTVCPPDVMPIYRPLNVAPKGLIHLLVSQSDRDWAARLLYFGVPRVGAQREERMQAWAQSIDRAMLQFRSTDSIAVKFSLLGIRVAISDMRGMNIEEAAEILAYGAVRSHATVLRQLYKSAIKDHTVDDLIVAAALKLLTKQIGSRHLLIKLVGEVLSARGSRLSERGISAKLKMPEMVSMAAAQ